ncbi:MAG: hypothetical protein AAFR87_34625, partial [Bacteroidota bacterium]
MDDFSIYDLDFEGISEYDPYESEDESLDFDTGEDYDWDLGGDLEDGLESSEARRYRRRGFNRRYRPSSRYPRRGGRYMYGRRPAYRPSRVISKPRTYYRYSSPTSQRTPTTKSVKTAFAKAGKDIQKTKLAIKSVDMDNQMIVNALKNQSKRISQSEYALAASTLVD